MGNCILGKPIESDLTCSEALELASVAYAAAFCEMDAFIFAYGQVDADCQALIDQADGNAPMSHGSVHARLASTMEIMQRMYKIAMK